MITVRIIWFGGGLPSATVEIGCGLARRCDTVGRSDVPLEVHHVNGDPSDNRIRNLIPLCRTCHHEATFPAV